MNNKIMYVINTFLICAVLFGGCKNNTIDLIRQQETAQNQEETAQENGEENQGNTVENWDTSGEEQGTDSQNQQFSLESNQNNDPTVIVVYVCGAVQAPGVYELPVQSRVVNAIEAAGGLTDQADPNYVNQARALVDGEQILVLTKEETSTLGTPLTEDSSVPGDSQQKLVNINTATKEELMTLSGIGQARAEAILSYRQDHGRFETIQDIMKISGIKEAAFEKIKDAITVG